MANRNTIIKSRRKSFPSNELTLGKKSLTGSKNKTSILVFCFILSIVTPLYFYLGPLRMPTFLLFLCILFIPMVFIWGFGINFKKSFPDYLILLYCMWATFSLIHAHGVYLSVEPAGVLWIQSFGSYLFGRIFVRNSINTKSIINAHAVIVVAILPAAAFEFFTAQPILIDLFGYIGSSYVNEIMETRMGFDRVQGVFEHPILFGIFAASIFSLFYFKDIRTNNVTLYLIAIFSMIISTFFSLSTGALLCLAVQFMLIFWDKVFKKNVLRWRYLIILVIIAYIVVDLISNRSPFSVFVDYLTLKSSTGYYRIHIWQYGFAEVLRHPLFGIGLNEWVRAYWMHSSIDNFWLVVAIRYGLPAFLALTGALLMIIIGVANAKGLDQTESNLRKGFVISFVGIFIAIASVHLWDATFCWFMFLVGSSVWLINSGQTTKQKCTEFNHNAEDVHRNLLLGGQPDPTSTHLRNAKRAAASVNRNRTSRGGGRL